MAIAERRNIEFGVEGGATLRGWLFVPGAKGPAPAITMAHGYAGVKGARHRTICTGFRGSRFCRAGP